MISSFSRTLSSFICFYSILRNIRNNNLCIKSVFFFLKNIAFFSRKIKRNFIFMSFKIFFCLIFNINTRTTSSNLSYAISITFNDCGNRRPFNFKVKYLFNALSRSYIYNFLDTRKISNVRSG